MTRTLISTRPPGQVLLVILLRIIPSRVHRQFADLLITQLANMHWATFQDLRDDLALPPLLVHLLRDIARDLLLLGAMVEDRRAILRSPVRTLRVLGRRVVHLVEVL